MADYTTSVKSNPLFLKVKLIGINFAYNFMIFHVSFENYKSENIKEIFKHETFYPDCR